MKGYIAILCTCCMTLLGCGSSEICDDDNQSYLVARFRTLVDDQITDTILDSLSLYGIRQGWSDSLLYEKESLNRVYLPLNPHENESRFVLSNQEDSDTLTITHRGEAYLISYECGYAVRFTLQNFDFGGGLIWEVETQENIVDAEILPSNEEHIWIYF